MNTPHPIQPQRKVDLKLGIKSSLPDVKSTIALFILIWEATERLADIIYAKQDGDTISASDSVIAALLVYTKNERQTAGISDKEFVDKVNENQLFKSQLEALIVAFELIWKLGKFTFQDGKSSGAERTGGKRYPKKIAYSANMDVLHYAVGLNNHGLSQTLLSWLGLSSQTKLEVEDALVHILCAFAEDAIFRLELNGGAVLIFNQLGIYQTGLEGTTGINISGDKEPKGALRILKNYLRESLNPFLTYQSSKASEVNVSADKTDELMKYAARVSVLAALKATDTVTPDIETSDSNDETSVADLEIKKLNRIFFGAPGTGKSHQLSKEAEKSFAKDNIERVTFYPNYSYAQFVGTYKPIMEGKDIAYAYVPGPFMRQWIRAMQNPAVPVLLIVEELNRANAPAVFGDTFQLLDRKNGVSEYSVATSEDLRKYLQSIISENNHALDGKADWEWLPADTKIDSISLPSNLYIWTTMNSADQGVFPLDTAFKRRWDNTYIGLDEKKDVIADRNFHFSGGFYNWDEFRTKINYLLSSCRVNEDKLLGPFFLNPIGLSDEDFVSKFKSKVLMYLYEDAARQCRSSVFAEDDNKKQRTYSEICSAFDQIGAGVFKGIQLTSVSTGTSQNSMVDSNNE